MTTAVMGIVAKVPLKKLKSLAALLVASTVMPMAVVPITVEKKDCTPPQQSVTIREQVLLPVLALLLIKMPLKSKVPLARMAKMVVVGEGIGEGRVHLDMQILKTLRTTEVFLAADFAP